MSYRCPLCMIDPLNHSLIKITEIDNVIYFYTCPSKAKLYYDISSIISHYDGVLSEIPNDKQWTWIFDSYDFNFIHFVQIGVGIELVKLISKKFSHNIKKIIIINPTFYTSSTYNILYPLFDNKLRSIIEFNKVDTTVSEVMDNH